VSVLRKILIAGIIGAVTFAVTTFTHQPPTWSVLLSVFISGVALVVQFLVDVENRLDALRQEVLDASSASKLFELPDSGPLSRAAVLQLVTHVASIDTPAADYL
jgi:hypothetical protein